MTNPMKAAVCDAEVLMGDGSQVAIPLQCEQASGHTGAHSHAMTACEPTAELTWWDA